MRLTHPDYVKLVTEAYYRKRASDDLSLSMINLTCAKLKDECIAVYQSRYERKDERILRTFFGPVTGSRTLLQVMENFDRDKFKPLVNYLKGESKRTDDKNIELLAWLIDFTPRPYVFEMEIPGRDEEKDVIEPSVVITPVNGSDDNTLIGDGEGKELEVSGGHDENNEDEVEITDGSENGEVNKDGEPGVRRGKTKRLTVAIALALLVCSLGIFAVWHRSSNKSSGCMIWRGDHYEALACDEVQKGQHLVPLDTGLLSKFRKIMRIDTITMASIGKIYYLKHDGLLEFFTAAGNHPVYENRSLKVLSPYMFDKYLNKQRALAGTQDSINR